ncbi:MAG: nitroreductase family protein [Candidatus Omnitrophota bacterium]
MLFKELISNRRTLRKYSSETVPREIIDRCLDAARLAPSACNSQPWYFVVIDDEGLRKRVGEAAFSGVYSMNSFARSAPILIIVVRDCTKYITKLGGFLRKVNFSLIDIGISCQNLVMQGEEESLGSCYLGWFDEKRVKGILNIPKNKKIDLMISLGYPEKEERPIKEKLPLDKIRSFNKI